MFGDLSLREARENDASSLGDFLLQSHIDNYAYFMPEKYYQNVNQTRFLNYCEKALSNNLYDQKSWIVEDNRVIVGFISAARSRYCEKGYEGFVDVFDFSKSHTGKGYGLEALQLCRSYIFDDLNLNGFLLFVYEHHSRARNFYEDQGGILLALREHNIIASGLAFDYVAYGWKR